MRIVRTQPHSSESRFFAGVPEPIWFDITTNEFPDPNAQRQGNRLYVNTLPADEVHFDFGSYQGDPTAVAGLKDADNFFDFKLRSRSDSDLPSSDKWLGAFDQQSFPPDQFPTITAKPPVPFPHQYFASFEGRRAIGGTYFNTIELARTIDGTRTVLQTKDIPVLLPGMTLSVRLSIVRKPEESATLIGCLVSFSKYGLPIDNDLGGDHGGAMQAFFLQADAQSEDCGPFCGYSL